MEGLPTEGGLSIEGVCYRCGFAYRGGSAYRRCLSRWRSASGVACLRVFGQITPKTRKVASTHSTEMLPYL